MIPVRLALPWFLRRIRYVPAICTCRCIVITEAVVLRVGHISLFLTILLSDTRPASDAEPLAGVAINVHHTCRSRGEPWTVRRSPNRRRGSQRLRWSTLGGPRDFGDLASVIGGSRSLALGWGGVRAGSCQGRRHGLTVGLGKPSGVQASAVASRDASERVVPLGRRRWPLTTLKPVRPHNRRPGTGRLFVDAPFSIKGVAKKCRVCLPKKRASGSENEHSRFQNLIRVRREREVASLRKGHLRQIADP